MIVTDPKRCVNGLRNPSAVMPASVPLITKAGMEVMSASPRTVRDLRLPRGRDQSAVVSRSLYALQRVEHLEV